MTTEIPVSKADILASAFSDGGYIDERVISDTDITTACRRYVIPVTGEALFDALASKEEYAGLWRGTVVPAIALGVRLVVQPRLYMATQSAGATVYSDNDTAVPSDAMRADVMLSVRRSLSTQLRALSEYLDNNAAAYPEYDARRNILNRCSTDGGIVQIR